MTTYSTPDNFRQPVLQYVGKREFQLVEDYVFEWESHGQRKRFWIPAGQTYDKASVPRWAWALFPPDGEPEAAALIHDLLYKFKGLLDSGWYQVFNKKTEQWDDDRVRWHRWQADDMLEYMGILGGMSKRDAAIFKWAVKVWPPNWFKGF